jgi:hypothetical protein
MIGGVLDTSFLSGGIGDALNNLAALGFFTYALPFLLIFALVFGILTRMGLFKENKAVTAIIALAVGLMALSVPTVPQFFSQIFPSMGIGLTILLVILIIVGLFSDPNKPWITVSLFIVAAIVALVVIVQSSGLDIWAWVQYNLGNTAGTLIIVGIVVVVIAVVIGREKKEKEPFKYEPYWAKVPQGK